MTICAHSIDDGLHCRVQKLDDQHEQARADQKRLFDCGFTEPKTHRDQHGAQRALLTERGFVLPSGSKPGQRKKRRVNDTAKAGIALDGHASLCSG
jgi:hypothetical protein